MATPRAAKRLFRNAVVRAVLCWIAANYVRLVWHTGKWQTINGDIPNDFVRDGRPAIICFWHGRLLMMPYAWPSKRPFFMLISQHPDGQLISRTVSHLGIQTIAGSTTRGGTGALREIVRTLNEGNYIGITPDGPRGPRMRASAGVINIARLTGAPLLPASVSSRRGKWFKGWDRFLLAAPFSGGTIVWGEPLTITKELDEAGIEEARRQLEQRLNEASAEADRLSGQQPVEPEPLATEAGA